MKVALLGYGKMGKMIESLLSLGDHEVVLKINSSNRPSITSELLKEAEVAIDFSSPDSVRENIKLCLEAGIPLVTGTTGWYDHLEEVKKWCRNANGALIYASNFSIGVNIFFELNRVLASLMKSRREYEPKISETHHLQKKDAPSGTAISLANDIIELVSGKSNWVNIKPGDSPPKNDNRTDLIILSHRIENVTGMHAVEYISSIDKIEIKHEAFSREGFAMGAIAAAEWIRDKKGIFEFRDIINKL